jgi:hypothetical protein
VETGTTLPSQVWPPPTRTPYPLLLGRFEWPLRTRVPAVADADHRGAAGRSLARMIRSHEGLGGPRGPAGQALGRGRGGVAGNKLQVAEAEAMSPAVAAEHVDEAAGGRGRGGVAGVATKLQVAEPTGTALL